MFRKGTREIIYNAIQIEKKNNIKYSKNHYYYI